ncbi:PREDICTED: uncharacterized protein LOC104772875 [Camelina sativa]|uniref:Uncharacterized protein LOC104772875 n=1 Tax=Camelina sativa TaxID=90675 RepID=A0ABM0Y592_CAMSA|nr:PREDICTED: uncharacterized protein LOC104772875 [Camelina sativa]
MNQSPQKGSPKSSPPKPPFSPRSKSGVLPSNKWVRDENTYCELHKTNGHSTRDCKKLMHLLAEKFVSGEMPSVTISELDPKSVSEVKEDAPPLNKPKTSNNGSTRKKRIDVIMGGSRLFRNSITAIKDHECKLASPQPKRIKITTSDLPEVTFSEKETKELDTPHDDALVISLDIANHEVCRILVDTGSSVDQTFLETLTRMGIGRAHIAGPPSPLVSFTSETTMSLGTITLPVSTQGVGRMVEFTVFDRPTAYNAIMGTPWLYQMKAVASTYHQCINSPTPQGVREILGSQRTARSCYLASHKLLVQ